MEYKSTPLQIIRAKWHGMMKRCYDPSEPGYHRYGGRGIGVSDDWHDFESFRLDVMPSWTYGMTMERIDNDGDYCLENFKWATRKEQASNRRSNVLITWDGATKTMTQWCEECGVKPKTAWQRINRYGWSPERAVGLTEDYFGI